MRTFRDSRLTTRPSSRAWSFSRVSNLGRVADPRAEAGRLVEQHVDQVAVPIILHSRDELWASELFDTAYARRDRLTFATRLMLARLAERQSDPDKIIDLLDGRVDLTQDP